MITSPTYVKMAIPELLHNLGEYFFVSEQKILLSPQYAKVKNQAQH